MRLGNLLPSHNRDVPPSQTRESKSPAGRGSNTKTKSSLIPPKLRNPIVAALAEFAGTFMFLFFAYGGTSIANNSAEASRAGTTNTFGDTTGDAADTTVLLYVSLAFGFSLMVNVWIFFRVSGGLFNPAVSPSPWKPPR